MPDPTQTATESGQGTPPATPSLEDMIAETVGAPAAESAEGAPPAEGTPPPEGAPAPVEGEPPVEGAPPVEGTPPAEGEPAPEEPDEHAKAVNAEMATLGITKPDTQARFRELANKAKEGESYRERYEQQQQVFQHMEASGISGEQFGLMTAIAADVNSQDPVRLKRAYDALNAELTGLAKQLGVEAPGFDPLSAHPDLVQQVNDGALEREAALKWARDRSQAQLATQARDTTTRQTAQEQAVVTAQGQLNALETELKARDPQYAAKRAILVPLIKPLLAQLAPDKWAPAFADAYRNVKLPAAPVAAANVRPDPANQGRPNGAAGAPTPKNSTEAVLMAMGMTPE